MILRGGRPPCFAETAREPFPPGLAGDVHMWGITPVMDPACPAKAARTIFSSCPAEAVHKGGAPPGLVINTSFMGNDLPVKRVPECVVAPLSYSLMDLACPVVAAQDSFFPVPPGDVHMGGALPDLVKNTSLAKDLVVGGFSECASILTSDPLMDLGCPTGTVLG